MDEADQLIADAKRVKNRNAFGGQIFRVHSECAETYFPDQSKLYPLE